MRKLKGTVEHNKQGKRVASIVMMVVLATSLAMSDSVVAVYAAEPSGYPDEYESETESEESTVDESVEEESTEEETSTEEATSEEETTADETAKSGNILKSARKSMLLGASNTYTVPTTQKFVENGTIVQLDAYEKQETDDGGIYTQTPSKVSYELNSEGYLSESIEVPHNAFIYVKSTDNSINIYVVYDNTWGTQFRSSNGAIALNYVYADGTPTEVIYAPKNRVTESVDYKFHIPFPTEDDQYDYTYTLSDGTTVVSKDDFVDFEGDSIDINVIKTAKGKINIKINGASKLVDYGVKLSTIAGVETGKYYQDINTGELYNANTSITKACELVLVDLTVTNEWFIINNSTDMKTFAETVNRGDDNARKINGRLTSDITLDSSFPMIGHFELNGNNTFTSNPDDLIDKCYMGTFDGQNHTVTVNTTGLFGAVSTGATIENLIVAGSVSNNYGAIVGTAYSKGGEVHINSCINNADVVSGTYAGGILGVRTQTYNLGHPSDMKVYFNHCGNTGDISGSGNVGGLTAKSMGYCYYEYCYNADDSKIDTDYDAKNIINCCYSLGDTGNANIYKPASAFHSGEVAYLMNKAENDNKWRQTCGTDTGAPALSGNTVYAGYANCNTTELSYSNTEYTHTEPGHKDKKDYSYSNGKIIAKCEYCDEEITAAINCPVENLSASMKGVTATYDAKWKKANFPNITFGYSNEKDGTYSSNIPSTVGTWYVKAYIAGGDANGYAIDETYTTKPKTESNDNNNSNESDNDTNTGLEEENNVNQLIAQINEYGKQAKTVDTTSTNGNKNSSLNNRTVEYTGSDIPNALISALRANPGTAIHYKCIYKGKKYEFTITSEDAALFDPSVKWYGPSYISHILYLRRLNIISPGRQYTVKENDTLMSILRRFGMSILEFFIKNPSVNGANDVKYGQKLNL